MENSSGERNSQKNENFWQKISRERAESKWLNEQKNFWLDRHPRVKVSEYDFAMSQESDGSSQLKVTKKGFDPVTYLNNMTEPMIEVGGPTENKYHLVDWEKLNREVIVSDIMPVEGNQMVTSVESLPFADNSLGAVFASALDSEHVRQSTIDEGYRVLKPGGLLVLQGFDIQGRSALLRAMYDKAMPIMQAQVGATADYYMILQKPIETEKS